MVSTSKGSNGSTPDPRHVGMFFHHQPRGEDRILGDENHDEPGTMGVAWWRLKKDPWRNVGMTNSPVFFFWGDLFISHKKTIVYRSRWWFLKHIFGYVHPQKFWEKMIPNLSTVIYLCKPGLKPPKIRWNLGMWLMEPWDVIIPFAKLTWHGWLEYPQFSVGNLSSTGPLFHCYGALFS